MATAPRDPNRVPTLIGVDSSDITKTAVVAVDTVTDRLLVSAVITSGGGAGTQYTEDVATPNPIIGGAIMVERDDQLSGVTPAQGDWLSLRGSDQGALWVAIADSSGDPITSFGGGTQYTEGDTDSTITGTAVMWEDTSNILRAVSSVKPLPTSVASLPLPSGAATAAKQLADGHNVTIDNASIAVTGTFFQATQPISAASLPLPSGAATSAKQLADGHNVTVDNATLPVTQSGTWNITNISGTISLPTGAATSAKQLAAGHEVSIGAASTDAGDLAKAEDAVHASGDVGVMSLGVRSDKLANLTSDSGDYTPLQVDFDGALYTNAKIFDPGTVDTFGHVITGEISNQIERQFFRDTPANLLTITSSNGGTTSQVGGSGKFESSTNVNGAVKGVTTLKTSYRSGSEIFTVFTASFTTPTDAGSYQRIGLYDINDGMFFGFEGTSFGITVRNGTSDTTVAKGSFSEDKLTGAIGSRFRRNGIPEAIDLTKLNVYRIRYGWLGSAPINFEVLSPDDEWVAMHIIRQPNNATTPSVENPDLPMTIDINKTTSDATNLIMLTNCWGAGTTTSSIPLDETLTDGTLSKSVRSILAAKKPNGTYQNIDSTAGGNLKMSVQEISDGLDIGAGNAGAETARVSISTDDVNLSAIKTAIEGTLTVDGSAVTQPVSGTFFQATQPISAASLPLPSGAATSANQLADGHNVTVDNSSSNEVFIRGSQSAGSPVDGEVITIQGIASMTALSVTESSPISGFATSANQLPDGHNVTVDNASIAVTGTFFQATQPISAASLPLPSGAATASNQLADGHNVTVDNTTLDIVGSVADDATTPGDPVMMGGFAISPDGTDPGSVSTEADVARLRTDLNRNLLVNTRHPRSAHKHLDGSSALTDTEVVADPGDGFQVVITSIIMATGAATVLNFFLEEGGTKIFGPVYLEATLGRGFVSGPIYLPVTASTAVTITTSASIAQSTDIDYFIQAV